MPEAGPSPCRKKKVREVRHWIGWAAESRRGACVVVFAVILCWGHMTPGAWMSVVQTSAEVRRADTRCLCLGSTTALGQTRGKDVSCWSMDSLTVRVHGLLIHAEQLAPRERTHPPLASEQADCCALRARRLGGCQYGMEWNCSTNGWTTNRARFLRAISSARSCCWQPF